MLVIFSIYSLCIFHKQLLISVYEMFSTSTMELLHLGVTEHSGTGVERILSPGKLHVTKGN